MNIEKIKKFLIHVAFIFVLTALFYFSMRFCLNYVLPLIIGLAAAVAVQKPAEYLSNKIRISKSSSALICAIVVYLIVFGLFAAFVVWLYFSLTNVYSSLPFYFEKISSFSQNIINKFEGIANKISSNGGETVNESVNAAVNTLVEKITASVSDFIGSIAKGTPAFLFSTLVAVISGCYIAKDFERFKKFVFEALPQRYIDSLALLKKIAVNNTFGMLKGYLILSIIAFGEISVFFFVFKINKPLIKALVISAVDILPVFGVGTVLIPWAVITAITANYSLTVKLVVVYFVVLIVRNMLEPKIVGKQIGIHPVITLLTIFVGLKIFGVVGMLVLPLVTTVLLQFFKEKYVASLGTKSQS